MQLKKLLKAAGLITASLPMVACGTLERLREPEEPVTVYVARPLPAACYVRPTQPREAQAPRILPEETPEERARNERTNLISSLGYWRERTQFAEEALDINANQMNSCVDGLPPQEPVE